MLKKKSNFFGYNYASINTKRGLFLLLTQLSNTLLLPQVVTHLIGEHTEYLSKLEKDSHRVKMISCARTHKMTLCREEHSLNTYHGVGKRSPRPPQLWQPGEGRRREATGSGLQVSRVHGFAPEEYLKVQIKSLAELQNTLLICMAF